MSPAAASAFRFAINAKMVSSGGFKNWEKDRAHFEMNIARWTSEKCVFFAERQRRERHTKKVIWYYVEFDYVYETREPANEWLNERRPEKTPGGGGLNAWAYAPFKIV